LPTHINLRYAEIENLWPGVERLQELAEQYGIKDVFQDAGGKLLQLLIATGLDIVPGREGADAKDRIGNLYEIKSSDITGKGHGFSTNHHLRMATLDKYRTRRWVFAMYDRITLMEAYLVEAEDLEPLFEKWEGTLKHATHINNPKIPLDLVRDVGAVMYLKDVAPPWVACMSSGVTMNDTKAA
jgi:Restriction endonuclease PvuII